jgi:hypothetical protein
MPLNTAFLLLNYPALLPAAAAALVRELEVQRNDRALVMVTDEDEEERDVYEWTLIPGHAQL